MIKKSFVILFISVFLFSIFLTGSVSAACFESNGSPIDVTYEECKADPELSWFGPIPETASTTSDFSLAELFEPDFATLASWLRVYEEGSSLSDTFIKYLFLALIVILVYSILAYSNFPESGTLRLFIAIVVGLLATISISPGELTAMLRSYTALGASLILFIPILILGFFTLVVASKVNPIGIFLQKILWIIYSVYLFISSGSALVMGNLDKSRFTFKFFEFFGGKAAETGESILILTILLVTSIAIFVIAVLGNDMVIAWAAKEKREADVEKYKDTARRSRSARETDAELTRERRHH